jgi:actin related protein 2/3 complex subunit 2
MSLTSSFRAAPVHIDQTVSDFDGVIFHISTPESKTRILVSIQIRCYDDLLRYGADEVLRREYGNYVAPAEAGYNFSVQVDLENLPQSKEERDDLISKISLLKRNAMAAPFEQAYQEHYQLREAASKYTSEEAPQGVREGGDVKVVQYREEEAIYVKASHDRVTVIFSTVFREETDRVFGRVFIQEFVDARRRAIQNAPQVLFRNDPPLELQGVNGVNSTGTGEIGYVTFGKLEWDCTARENVANGCSVVPSPSDAPTDERCHLAHPDLPRLLPLPHQGLQGVHPLPDAPADGRLPPR